MEKSQDIKVKTYKYEKWLHLPLQPIQIAPKVCSLQTLIYKYVPSKADLLANSLRFLDFSTIS